MDGHPRGSRQRPPGQNPAYRATPRHFSRNGGATGGTLADGGRPRGNRDRTTQRHQPTRLRGGRRGHRRSTRRGRPAGPRPADAGHHTHRCRSVHPRRGFGRPATERCRDLDPAGAVAHRGRRHGPRALPSRVAGGGDADDGPAGAPRQVPGGTRGRPLRARRRSRPPRRSRVLVSVPSGRSSLTDRPHPHRTAPQSSPLRARARSRLLPALRLGLLHRVRRPGGGRPGPRRPRGRLHLRDARGRAPDRPTSGVDHPSTSTATGTACTRGIRR